MARKMKPLKPEQISALRAYAEWAGADWKTRLTRDWLRGGSEWGGPWGHLQRARNTHGPSWLEKFALKGA